MTVKTILSRKGRNVVTIEPSATLQAATATLVEHRIGAVVVLGADRRDRPSLGVRCRARICGIRRGCVVRDDCCLLLRRTMQEQQIVACIKKADRLAAAG